MNVVYAIGDRVQFANGGPVMEVIGYGQPEEANSSERRSKSLYLCRWYDHNIGEYKERIFSHTELVDAPNYGFYNLSARDYGISY